MASVCGAAFWRGIRITALSSDQNCQPVTSTRLTLLLLPLRLHDQDELGGGGGCQEVSLWLCCGRVQKITTVRGQVSPAQVGQSSSSRLVILVSVSWQASFSSIRGRMLSHPCSRSNDDSAYDVHALHTFRASVLASVITGFYFLSLRFKCPIPLRDTLTLAFRVCSPSGWTILVERLMLPRSLHLLLSPLRPFKFSMVQCSSSRLASPSRPLSRRRVCKGRAGRGGEG